MQGLSETETKKIADIQAKTKADQAKEADETKKSRIDRDGELAQDAVQRGSWLNSAAGMILALIAFAVLAVILFWQGLQRPPKELAVPEPPDTGPPQSG
jgi:hypothetical protein